MVMCQHITDASPAAGPGPSKQQHQTKDRKPPRGDKHINLQWTPPPPPPNTQANARALTDTHNLINRIHAAHTHHMQMHKHVCTGTPHTNTTQTHHANYTHTRHTHTHTHTHTTHFLPDKLIPNTFIMFNWLQVDIWCMAHGGGWSSFTVMAWRRWSGQALGNKTSLHTVKQRHAN